MEERDRQALGFALKGLVRLLSLLESMPSVNGR